MHAVDHAAILRLGLHELMALVIQACSGLVQGFVKMVDFAGERVELDFATLLIHIHALREFDQAAQLVNRPV
jgi:hypothetical protein